MFARAVRHDPAPRTATGMHTLPPSSAVSSSAASAASSAASAAGSASAVGAPALIRMRAAANLTKQVWSGGYVCVQLSPMMLPILAASAVLIHVSSTPSSDAPSAAGAGAAVGSAWAAAAAGAAPPPSSARMASKSSSAGFSAAPPCWTTNTSHRVCSGKLCRPGTPVKHGIPR